MEESHDQFLSKSASKDEKAKTTDVEVVVLNSNDDDDEDEGHVKRELSPSQGSPMNRSYPEIQCSMKRDALCIPGLLILGSSMGMGSPPFHEFRFTGNIRSTECSVFLVPRLLLDADANTSVVKVSTTSTRLQFPY
jgi:hypothetical protein